tara:strand:+ start:1613 stop:2074 length:462 start_codon:yes stop_codon:yes gene_type:complete
LELKNYRLNRAVNQKPSIAVKEQFHFPRIMGFFKRFFQKNRLDSETTSEGSDEDQMLSVLKDRYERDIDQDVSTIESILDDDEEQLEETSVEPAPDYDQHEATADDVLTDDDMVNFSDKNVVEHDTVEELGNHLQSARIEGDISEEVSFSVKE